MCLWKTKKGRRNGSAWRESYISHVLVFGGSVALGGRREITFWWEKERKTYWKQLSDLCGWLKPRRERNIFPSYLTWKHTWGKNEAKKHDAMPSHPRSLLRTWQLSSLQTTDKFAFFVYASRAQIKQTKSPQSLCTRGIFQPSCHKSYDFLPRFNTRVSKSCGGMPFL